MTQSYIDHVPCYYLKYADGIGTSGSHLSGTIQRVSGVLTSYFLVCKLYSLLGKGKPQKSQAFGRRTLKYLEEKYV